MRKRALGALPGKKDIRDYTFRKKVCKAGNYPETYECPLKTPIKDQKMVSSCVAFAASSILEYHNPEETLSTNFIYGIRNKLFNSKGEGMLLREACSIARHYGDPTAADCPGNTEVDKVFEIAEDAFADKDIMERAKDFRIASYAKVSANNDIKYALMHYGPVLGAIIWYDDNKADRTTGLLTKGTQIGGGHAIVVRGWNQQGWICQNSWGLTFGKKGYFILPYNYKLVEAYSFIPGEVQDDVVKPNLWGWVYKLINAILNIFKG